VGIGFVAERVSLRRCNNRRLADAAMRGVQCISSHAQLPNAYSQRILVHNDPQLIGNYR
jgi:hypothetical protein